MSGHFFSFKIAGLAIALLLAVLVGVNAFGVYAPRVLAAGGADLTIQDITLSPQEPAIDDQVTITVAVKNQGSDSAGTNKLECYIDTTLLDTKTISSLAAGMTTSLTFSWTATQGSHVVKAVADAAGQIVETDETNNIKIFNFSTLASDLAIPSVTCGPQSFSKGDTVTLTTTIRNQGSAKSKATDSKFYIDGVQKDSKDIPALNPGGTATVTYTWVATAGQHAAKVTVDSTNLNKESDETNNEAQIALSTSAPDLIISAMSQSPQNPSLNDVVTFTVTVKNQGTGRADASSAAYYIDDLFITSIPVISLDAGASTNITFTWTATQTAHTLKVTADYDNKVVESDETNNTNTANLALVAPDLIAYGMTWTPQDAGVGDLISISVIIKNQGTGRAAASYAAYYINNIYQGSVSVKSLDPGATDNVTVTWTADYGDLIVTFTVDSSNILNESNETNNRLTATIPIAEPDLTITNIVWSPLNPAVGDTVTFTICVLNQGHGKAGGFNMAYYIDGTLMDSEVVFSLARETSANFTCEWQAQAGRHIFKAVADSSLRLTESNEKNNTYSVTVIPFMPDLTIGKVTWSPLDIPVGAEITFNMEVQNIGALQAGVSRVAYYVDGVATGYDYIGSIEAGETIVEHFTWVATAGSHTFNIVADADNQISEVDESNNTKTVSIPPPDLTIQSITTTPANANPGDTLTITATVANRGGTKSQDSLVTLYIDGVQIESQDLPPINPGDMTETSFNWGVEAGSHTFKVTADLNNTVTEADETNNDAELTFAAMTPDLVVQSLTWTTNDQLASNEINFTITVKNTGTGEAGAYKLKYSFDGAAAITKDMPQLAAGDTAQISFIAIMSAGSHTADITVDPDNVISELNETNNTYSLTFSTIAPDLVVRTLTWSPLDAAPGDTITITAKVENQGTIKATNPQMTLYIDGEKISSTDISDISSNAAATVDFTWTVTAGEHQISVTANTGGTIKESNEENNTKTRSATFETPSPPPKHTVSEAAIAAPDKGFLGTYWWLLLIIAAGLGAGAFFTAIRGARKKF